LVSKLQTSLLFSDIISDDTYFTGLAILNPGSIDAMATIEIHNSDGTLIQKIDQPVPAGHRLSKLLTELFSSLQGRNQSSGYIRLTSDQPVASFILFGTQNLTVTSAIPPHVVQ
jgi:hypothetical protein